MHPELEGTEPRQAIVRFLRANPGMHFRGLQRALDLTPGQAEHHLHRLLQDGHVVARPLGGYTFYFPASAPRAERAVQGPLRQRTRRAIAEALARSPQGLADLAEATGKTPSTLHHHLQVLLAAEAVRVAGERPLTYTLTDAARKALFPGLV